MCAQVSKYLNAKLRFGGTDYDTLSQHAWKSFLNILQFMITFLRSWLYFLKWGLFPMGEVPLRILLSWSLLE